jgi:hypothetical protein
MVGPPARCVIAEPLVEPEAEDGDGLGYNDFVTKPGMFVVPAMLNRKEIQGREPDQVPEFVHRRLAVSTLTK